MIINYDFHSPASKRRQRQLSWVPPGSIIQQDHELIDFIKKHHYQHAVGKGEVDFLAPYVDFVEDKCVDLIVYIQVDRYDFDELILDINHTIKVSAQPGCMLYLSVNKYAAIPRCYDQTLPDDYDQAILQFIQSRVHANLKNYFPCGEDRGNKFNWVHPLTRFYLQVP